MCQLSLKEIEGGLRTGRSTLTVMFWPGWTFVHSAGAPIAMRCASTDETNATSQVRVRKSCIVRSVLCCGTGLGQRLVHRRGRRFDATVGLRRGGLGSVDGPSPNLPESYICPMGLNSKRLDCSIARQASRGRAQACLASALLGNAH